MVASDHVVISDDYYGHSDESPDATTWRSAVVHWGEGLDTDDWKVTGYHFVTEEGITKLVDVTEATDCNIYDGWWDKDPPDKPYKT